MSIGTRIIAANGLTDCSAKRLYSERFGKITFIMLTHGFDPHFGAIDVHLIKLAMMRVAFLVALRVIFTGKRAFDKGARNGGDGLLGDKAAHARNRFKNSSWPRKMRSSVALAVL